jgi:hypothetical protein
MTTTTTTNNDNTVTTPTTYDFEDGNGPVPAHQHGKGSGWVANTATVGDKAFVGLNARVFGSAKVLDTACVFDNARVFDSAVVSEEAAIYDNACVFGAARVSGAAKISHSEMLPGLDSAEQAPATPAEGDKESNPKEACGSVKVPLSYFPVTAIALGSMALLAGACKYGRNNWRVKGVRVSTYYDALLRHMTAYWEGEEIDPEDGVSHLGHALACLAILADAEACGKVNDDRPCVSGWSELKATLTPDVTRIRSLYADRNPKHYTREQ